MTKSRDRPDLSFVTIDAGTLEYCFFQPAPSVADTSGNAPTVTLLHEGLGCVALWREFPENIADATGMRVLAYSRFGYGGSDACRLPRPINYMHDEALTHLPALLDALDVQRTILFGHSDGASIATIYAGEIGDPRVEALVLVAPHFFCEDLSIRSIGNARAAWDTGSLRTRLERYHGTNVDCAFLGWNDAWLAPEFRSFDIRPELAKIDLPILGIQRSEDPYGTRRQLDGITATEDPRREIHFIDGVGHAPHQETQEETLAIVRAFLTKHGLVRV